jgi:hypothetical protein
MESKIVNRPKPNLVPLTKAQMAQRNEHSAKVRRTFEKGGRYTPPKLR